MRPVQFLLDENAPPAFLVALRRRSTATITRWVGDDEAPLKGTKDPDLLVWCEQHHAALISLDRSTLPDHFADHINAGRQCWGLFIIRKYANLSHAIEDLIDIAGASHAEDWLDQIVYLPFNRSAVSRT